VWRVEAGRGVLSSAATLQYIPLVVEVWFFWSTAILIYVPTGLMLHYVEIKDKAALLAVEKIWSSLSGVTQTSQASHCTLLQSTKRGRSGQYVSWSDTE
jgi:hypothetical protein